ncbi:MAG: UDP-N-acetylmuramoyl-L-alanine--D-glutamate ligase, partial [bacterium]|nr:UDP-N-acetylmuramoyl-L-alanine--D-glutamate ligase [bacterium]
RGDAVTVTDLKEAHDLRDNIEQLRPYKNVRFVLGRHDLKDVQSADLVVRNPRVRSDSPEIKEAIKRGIPIESDISLFLAHCPATVIGVTGTRGKSTTATLIAELLKAGGKRVHLGGNILVSPLTFLSRVKKSDIVVLELSSWQLEATGEKGVSPHIAVWTNLMRDHLNTYPGMEEYAEAKAQIFRHQDADGLVFLPGDDLFDAYAESAPGAVERFGKKGSEEFEIVANATMKLLGEHNKKNAEAAVAVALALGVSSAKIHKTLETFKGLQNRLELVREYNGIRFVNDTTATTPDATIAAIKALQKSGPLHLIFGGADKELEFNEVASVIAARQKPTPSLPYQGGRSNIPLIRGIGSEQARAFEGVSAHGGLLSVYLLPGTAHEKIINAFKKSGVSFQDVEDLHEAFKVIRQRVKKGDTVLLSPGCASFGLFKNEFDRGDQFKKLVKNFK